MSQKSSKKVESLTLKPSECAAAIRAMIPTKRALFVWGPPGISKSATGQQVAADEAVAFIDVRLSQMDPTDLRGIPYPVKEQGISGVRWSPPLVLPRDLDYSIIAEVEAEESLIRFSNPTGSNGIRYCTNPKISVRSLTKGATAEIISKSDDSFVVALKDASGNLVAGKVHWEVTGETKGILALEEFNSAPPSVQAAAYQLVLDRALGEYKVPDGVFIIAMGNRDTDKGVTFKMPTPIMNRFVHIEMKVDFDDWQRWALTQRVHADVVGYLTAFKEQLFQFDAGTAARGFPTPRSWHFVSDILVANDDMPDSVATGLVCGAIGDGAGIQFMEFRKIANDLPDARDILSGKLKKMDKKVEVQLAYALTTTLCYELKERADKVKRTEADSADRKQWYSEADNFLEFIMANFQPEICIMGAKAAISVHKLPFDARKMKHLETFTDKFKKLIVG